MCNHRQPIFNSTYGTGLPKGSKARQPLLPSLVIMRRSCHKATEFLEDWKSHASNFEQYTKKIRSVRVVLEFSRMV
jgi:hypothetical protein